MLEFLYLRLVGLGIITVASCLKNNQLEACNECCACPARYGNNQKISNSPFLYKSCMDDRQPYGYENSNLKNLYLSDYQLQCRMVAPILTQEELLRKYPNAN